jgi:hypothetical protein
MSGSDRPKILFLNIGWMKYYEGPTRDDPTIGGHGWLTSGKGHTHGHECYNFANQRGYCYGSHPGSVGTNLQRLGATASSESVEGILVIWFSRNPRGGKAYIVGWYKSATVYRRFQKRGPGVGNLLKGEPIDYKVRARYTDCLRLEDARSCRSFEIPTRITPGGYGQNPNWYGTNNKFLDKVWDYVQSYEARQRDLGPRRKLSTPRNPDPQIRILVEQNAIRIATEHYESPAGGSREVKSVERENLGWDLVAKNRLNTLKIEVKGVSSVVPIAELTPNEFVKMKEHKYSWVLFIVVNCLSQNPGFYEFRFNSVSNCWETTSGGLLAIQEKTAAVVSLI